MQKDVIYIDVDDDITAIIGKLKESKEKIVALIPPKRVGVLQSAVNLRLLMRNAEQAKKHLVIITGNEQLTMLAAAAKIPIAKTLQSKPELPQIDALEIDDGEEVIDGSQLAVGEHAKQGKSKKKKNTTAAAIEEIDAENKAAVSATAVDVADKKAKKPKVPNFDIFRKKLVLILLGLALLIGFLVWAIVFAPHAKVILQTKTSDVAVSQQVTLKAGAETSAKNATISATVKQVKKDISVPISLTGKKNAGEKASGTVQFSNTSPLPKTVTAGTVLTSSAGLSYEVSRTVQVPAAELGWDCPNRLCMSTASGAVMASESGSKYNADSGALKGASVSAKFTSATSGGTDKTVAVATQGDIDKALDQAKRQIDENALKTELKKQFESQYVAINESLSVKTDSIKSNVEVDGEAPAGGAKVVGTATVEMYAVDKQQLDTYLTAVIEQQIDDKERQRLYKTGADAATFTSVEKTDGGVRANISTNGKVGPRITEEKVKEIAKGKGYGQIQSSLEAFQGIDSVDVKFSPFWVSSAPDDIKKITVEFSVHE